jgi:hypothetical protein
MESRSMMKGNIVLVSLVAATCATAALVGAADQPPGATTKSQPVIEQITPAPAPPVVTAPSSQRHETVPGGELGKGREIPMKAPEDEGAMFLPLELKGPDARDVEISREQDARSATSF